MPSTPLVENTADVIPQVSEPRSPPALPAELLPKVNIPSMEIRELSTYKAPARPVSTKDSETS